MDGTAADIAAQLPLYASAFLLLFVRIGGACVMLPGIAEAEVPIMVRAGIALALTALLLPVLGPSLPAPPDSVWRFAGMVGAELLSGLFLGWLARLPALVLPLAGQTIAMLIGQASVLQPDSVFGSQATAISRMLGLAAPVLVLSTGLHALALSAIVGSYRVIPAGTLLPAGDAAQTIITGVADLFALSLRLSAPFLVVGIVWHCTIAVISRLIPRVQMIFIAAPAQLLGGLALLGILAITLLEVWHERAMVAMLAMPGL